MKLLHSYRAFIFCGIGLHCCTAWIEAAPKTDNLAPRGAQALRFRRGATSVLVRGFLAGSQSRFYTVKIRAGQKLRISAAPASKNRKFYLVPLIAVTPPRGSFNGDKTPIYTSNFTRSGFYRIRVSANQMASSARSGYFALRVWAR